MDGKKFTEEEVKKTKLFIKGDTFRIPESAVATSRGVSDRSFLGPRSLTPPARPGGYFFSSGGNCLRVSASTFAGTRDLSCSTGTGSSRWCLSISWDNPAGGLMASARMKVRPFSGLPDHRRSPDSLFLATDALP